MFAVAPPTPISLCSPHTDGSPADGPRGTRSPLQRDRWSQLEEQLRMEHKCRSLRLVRGRSQQREPCGRAPTVPEQSPRYESLPPYVWWPRYQHGVRTTLLCSPKLIDNRLLRLLACSFNTRRLQTTSISWLSRSFWYTGRSCVPWLLTVFDVAQVVWVPRKVPPKPSGAPSRLRVG